MSKDIKEQWNALYAPNGVFSIRKLFRELSTPSMRKKYPPMFTLKPYDYKGLPSAYRIYMESTDEFEAASKLVPNMKTWDQLKNASWFLNGDVAHSFDGLVSWRRHMKDRDNSLAHKALLEKAENGDVTAAKAIIAHNKVTAPVGRKNKKTKEEKASITRIEEFRKKG